MTITLPGDGEQNWDVTLNAALTQLDQRLAAIEAAPVSGVVSVNGVEPDVNGLVTLNAGDVGAAATSHAHAQSDITGLSLALAAKADDAVVVKVSGNQTIAGTKTFSSAPSVPDSSFAVAKTTNLQTLLDALKYIFIKQNSDGSWPARTTSPGGSDRTTTKIWVGTLPGPTIGGAAADATTTDIQIVTTAPPS